MRLLISRKLVTAKILTTMSVIFLAWAGMASANGIAHTAKKNLHVRKTSLISLVQTAESTNTQPVTSSQPMSMPSQTENNATDSAPSITSGPQTATDGQTSQQNGGSQNLLAMPDSISYQPDAVTDPNPAVFPASSQPVQITAPAAAHVKNTVQIKKTANQDLAFNFTLPKALQDVNQQAASAAQNEAVSSVQLPTLMAWVNEPSNSPYIFTPLSSKATAMLYLLSLLLFLTGIYAIIGQAAPLGSSRPSINAKKPNIQANY